MRTRNLAITAVLAGVLVATSPLQSGAASHPLTLSAPSVAVGDTVTAKLADCVATAAVYRYPELRLVVGSGPAARVADLEPGQGRTWLPLTVPGWVDPADPAVIEGACIEQRQVVVDGVFTTTLREVFAADATPVDITPAAGPVAILTIAASRTTAAQGQTITITGAGCPPGGFGAAALHEGADPTLATGARVLTSTTGGGVGEDGTFTATLTLNTYDQQAIPQRIPVPEGPHLLTATCRADPPTSDTARLWAEPQVVTVEGGNPTGSLSMVVADRTLVVSGTGCTGGRTVDLFLDGGFDGASPPVSEHRTVVPDANGSWAWTRSADPAFINLEVTARCGDPAADGFAYVVRRLASQENRSTVVALDPQPALAGQTVVASITGSCQEAATVVVLDGDEVLARSEPFNLRTSGDPSDTIAVEISAPAAPGTYEVRGSCAVGTHAGLDLKVVAAAEDDGGAPPPAVPVPGAPGYTG